MEKHGCFDWKEVIKSCPDIEQFPDLKRKLEFGDLSCLSSDKGDLVMDALTIHDKVCHGDIENWTWDSCEKFSCPVCGFFASYFWE